MFDRVSTDHAGSIFKPFYGVHMHKTNSAIEVGKMVEVETPHKGTSTSHGVTSFVNILIRFFCMGAHDTASSCGALFFKRET